MKTFGVIVVGFAAFAFLFVQLDRVALAQDAKDEKKEVKKDDEPKEMKKEKPVRLPDWSEVNRAKKSSAWSS